MRLFYSKENVAYCGDTAKGLEQKLVARYTSEKPLSLRSAQFLKFKGKPKYQRKSACQEDELVRHMSKLPEFLQREKLQGTIFNVGVLDWGLLKKWTQKKKNDPVTEITDKRASGSCFEKENGISVTSSLSCSELVTRETGQLTSSLVNSSDYVDHSISGTVVKNKDVGPHLIDALKYKEVHVYNSRQYANGLDLKSVKGKGKNLDHGHSSVMGIQSAHGKHGQDQRATSFSAEMNRDTSARYHSSFNLPRLTRTLSMKEHSGIPYLQSTYVDPASPNYKPQVSTSCETLNNKKTNASGKTRNSPFKRSQHSKLNYKVANPMKERPNDLMVSPLGSVPKHHSKKSETTTIKALMHMTVKGGIPFFKFVVKSYNEILACTVKCLKYFDKNDSRWLYTFYSARPVRKKNGSLINHKIGTCEYSYNVIGQMKVSYPRKTSCHEQEPKEQNMVKESVLYRIDLSTATSEFKRSTELAAFVVKICKCKIGSHTAFSNCHHSDFIEDRKFSDMVVIIPGGIHNFPSEGGPFPLIKRWRTGGSCDCGGWDVGCKLRILTNYVNDVKVSKYARSFPMQCELYDQGDGIKRRPLFTMVQCQDGLFSVEFDANISSLQAFSICAAAVDSHSSFDVNLKEVLGIDKASIAHQREGPKKHMLLPPLSPVGRM